MTIPELAERIEERLAELQQEIVRLQAADDALAATRTNAAAAQPTLDPRRSKPRYRVSRPDSSTRAAARRASKPAAVLALARELDAGLRNSP